MPGSQFSIYVLVLFSFCCPWKVVAHWKDSLCMRSYGYAAIQSTGAWFYLTHLHVSVRWYKGSFKGWMMIKLIHSSHLLESLRAFWRMAFTWLIISYLHCNNTSGHSHISDVDQYQGHHFNPQGNTLLRCVAIIHQVWLLWSQILWPCYMTMITDQAFIAKILSFISHWCDLSYMNYFYWLQKTYLSVPLMAGYTGDSIWDQNQSEHGLSILNTLASESHTICQIQCVSNHFKLPILGCSKHT